MAYRLNQIIEFTDEYPEGLYGYVTSNGYMLVEIEPVNGNRRVKIVEIPEETEEQRRQRLDNLTLTPSDVERALLAAKGWDFDDLKTYLKHEQNYTDLQIKAIGIELRANDFYRGATLKGTNIRIVDTIGALLGYTPDDMDYLFEHKQLPEQ